MAKRIQATTGGFNWNYILMAAGVAILAPYVIRRVMPLLSRDPMNVTGRDVALAGKDAVRDAADDLNVGGIKGTLGRAVDRVADRL